MKSTSYLRRLDDVVDRLCEDHSLTKDQVEGILDHFFITLKEFITDWRMPKILLSNFGSFHPAPKRINYRIWRLIRAYRRGRVSREKTNEVIKRLWAVKQRLYAEQAGEETLRAWNRQIG